MMGEGTYQEYVERKIDRLYEIADAPGCPEMKSKMCLEEIKYLHRKLNGYKRVMETHEYES